MKKKLFYLQIANWISVFLAVLLGVAFGFADYYFYEKLFAQKLNNVLSYIQIGLMGGYLVIWGFAILISYR